jgi:hypothetical protein
MAERSADVIASIFSGENEAWAKSFIAPLFERQLRETPVLVITSSALLRFHNGTKWQPFRRCEE